MPETEASLRERALAAWKERRQEMQVEASKRDAEAKLRVVRAATDWFYRVAHDIDPLAVVAAQSFDNWARGAGVKATTPERAYGGGPWTADITAEGITLRWTSMPIASTSPDRIELVAECPDCGAEVLFGHRIRDLTSLGVALDEQADNPKGMHRCPEPADDLNDDGEPMVTVMTEVDAVDPAHVLLDALQGYIHAAIDARVDRHPVRWATGVPATEEDAF